MSTPFRLPNNWLPQSIDRHEATVVGLFLCRCPANVAGFVIAVVVDAVKLVFRAGPSANGSNNVGDEILVGVPLRGKFYSSTAVALPVFAIGIATTLASLGPNLPFRGPPAPVTMASVFSTDGFVLFASARLDVVRFQIWSRYNVVLAANAETKPMSVAAFCVNQRDDGQEIKLLTGKIDDLVLTFRHTFVMPVGDANVNTV